MVDSTLLPQSEAFNQGLSAAGYGSGKSIFSQADEPTKLDQGTVDTFTTIANKYGVPADVLLGMAEKDSGFNAFNRSRGPGPKVRGIINVSDEDVSKGEYNPYDTAQNVDAAARKLRSYMDAGMSVEEAVKAHAAGPDKTKWGPDADAYERDVMGRSARLSETYYPGMAPRVLETDGKPSVDQIRQAYGIEEEKKDRPNIAMQAVGDVQRGLYNVGNTAIGLGAIAADVAGFEDASAALAKRFVLNSKLNEALNPETIGSYKNIRTDDVGNFVSDAGRYAVEAIFENMPQMAASMGAGAVGAQLGKRAAEKIVTGIVEKQVAAGATRAAAEQAAAKIVAQSMGAGAAAGAWGSSTGMEAADIYGDVYEKTGQRAPGTALGFGAVAGALDAVESVTALRAVAGESVTNAIKGALVKRLGVEGAKQFAIEAGTEGLQTIVENAAVTATDGRKLFTPELADQVIDSMLKGGIAGGVTGVATQGINEMRGGQPVTPPASQQQQERREPTIDGSVTTAPEGAAPAVEPQTRADVSQAATTEAARDLAAGAPGRQTVSEVEQPAKPQPATARPGGQGPLSRVLETQAPDVAPLATAAGERVTLSDEMGSLTGAIVSQDADGVLFKSDDGAELLIDNQEIASGKVSIAKGGEAPVSQAPIAGPETNFGTMPAPEPVVAQEAPVTETQAAPAKAAGDSDIAEQAVAAITEPPIRFKQTYEDMSEPELRDRMKYIAGQAKAAGGWNKMLIDERKKVEKAINALKAPAPALPENEKPASAAEPVKAESKPAKVADEATMRHLLSDYSMTPKAMQAKIDNYGLNDTHEVTQNDKGRFVITPKAEAPAATVKESLTTDQPISGFKTAKGSTYQVHEDGTTTRDKAARNEPGHEGDSGVKKQTARTIYVDSADKAQALSSAGLSNRPEGGMHVILRDGKATLISKNTNGEWGASPSGRDVPFSEAPEVGKHPVELWNPTDLNGETVYGGQHAGNKIVELTSAPTAAPAPQIKETPASVTSAPASSAANLPNATAPEHVQTGVDDRELGQIVSEFNAAQEAMVSDGEKVTHVFDAPAKGEIVRLADKVKVYNKEHGWMTPAEAKARINEWKANAEKQGKTNANNSRVVLSLFDLTGKWSQPWEEAGYQVWRFDIQDNPEMGDVNNFSSEFFSDWFGDFDGQDIYAILAACPCTDFAVSGARHFAAKDADGRTVASVKLVHQTLAAIEYFKPAVWAIENPVGRIEKLGGLPPWRLAFDPNHIGEDYTKKTLLWGRFNADLPIAPTEPTAGSKMHTQFGGKSMATKNARSATPEGFAYSFFQANNAVDNPAMAIANKFDRLDRSLIEKAVSAGVTEGEITQAVEDFYYQDMNDAAVNKAIQNLIDSKSPPAPDKTTAEKKLDRKRNAQRREQKKAKAKTPDTQSVEPASAPAVSNNTVFTNDAYAAAVARFNKRHKGASFNSGIDPEDLADGIIMAGYHIEKGARTFSAYAEAMLETLGEKVRPFLKSWYLGVKFDPRGASFDGMDSAGAVEAFDLASLNGERNEPAKLDQPSAGSLEGVSANAVQGTTESRETGAGAETSGGTDVSRTGPVGRKRNGPAGSVGDGQGALSLPAGGTGTERLNEPASGKRAQDTAADFAISEEDRIGEGGKKTKYKQNIEAIRIVKRLAETGASPSAADQKALAKYVGWGGIPEAFERSDGSLSKGWEKEAKELKELLTADEYAEAAASTQYAHYTAPEVVSAMWDGMRRMGFTGGRVLEPGMGVGNFFGLMPKDLRTASALHGVEKDIITGGVAKGLYPAAKIAAPMDFRDYTIPEGYFDAAIGNPPFASTKIKDTVNRDISGFSLHNYFFAKALNGLKPGGVMSMVVTSRMLDSISDTSRKYMADRADLVAAIRLPNNAFLKNAGTQVTTDIIILRKRERMQDELEQRLGKKAGETWAKVGEYTNEKGQTVPLNEYFIRHPENMLGEFGPFGSMYNPDEPALVAREGQDTAALLREAMARLPENITTGSAVEVKEETPISAVSVEHVRVGSAFMHDGKVMLREPDRLGEPQASEATFASEKAKERVVGMVGVRDAFAKLRAMQLNAKATDKQIADARKALNDVYDKFVRKNGYINEEANKRLFRDDPSWPQISALEDDFSKGITPAVAKTTGQAPAKPSAKKAAIFSKRTQSPYAPPTKAATAKDALLASLSERGRVDLDLMQKLYGKDHEAILKELGDLVFNDPIRGPVTREEYLSGNVKAKLGQAIEAAQKDPAMQRNVDALREVQPADVEAIDIDVKIGSHWIPIGVMREFASHILGNISKLKVIYNPATAGWTVSGEPSADASIRWGTNRARPAEIIEAAANQRAIVIRDKQSDGSYVLNEVDTQAANDKVQAVKDEWRRWIFDEDSRRETLASLYNEMFNTNVKRSFDGSHLTFPGKVGDDVVRLRPHQANAVWRALQSSTTLFDHVVGAGKTFTMVAAAMEMRRMGLAKKPMFVVPNHLVGQWAADFVKLYPNAQILAATKKDFEKENRKKLFARIATGDWDAVIVAHSSFAKVEVDPVSQNAFIEKQVADLLKTEEAMREADGKDSRNVKQVQNRIEKLREKQKRLLDTGAKDDSLYWKELGVDALFLDEAHEFKNLEFSTSMQRVAGLGNQSGSQKASDLYLKVNQVLEATGGRNIVFATGTPISNTMAEMFTMQRYLDGKALEEQGLSHFDAWARLYGDVVTDWELSPSGTYKMNSRFAKFVNMPELMQRYTSFADVINRDDINAQLAARGEKLPVPKIKGGKPQNIVVERSPDQAVFMASLVDRSEKLPKKVTKGSDNMLKIMSDARKSALDMRLIDPAYPDYAESKVNNSANRIVDLYKKWDADKGTQLVFIDLSTPKGAVAKEQAALRELISQAEAGDEAAQEKLDAMSPDELLALDSKFSVYDDLKQKLIDRGIPENEIAFIHDATTELKKEELFGKVKSGRVRVLFGSTAKMGAGMNVQERLVALHHLDAPWRPSDLEQREGRIIRQGNKLYERDPNGFEVEINRYAAKATLDSRMWQTIEGKARFIEQVRKGKEGSREIEDIAGEAANAAEMKAAASGNPLILEEMTLRQRVKKLENEERAHRQEQWSIKDRIKQNEQSIKASEASLADMREDAKVEIPEEFAMSIRGETFDKRKEAGAKIIEEAFNMRDAGARSAAIGNYGGFKITLNYRPETLVFHLTLKGKGEYTSSSFASSADPQGVAQRLVMLARETRDIASVEKGIAERKSTIEKLTSQVKDWPKADELAEAKKRHGDIIAELKPKQKPAEAPAEEAPKASIGRGAGMSPSDLRDTLTRGVDGPIIKAMLDSGKVVIQTTNEGMPAGSQAVTMPDGTIRLAASNLDASTARGILLHEVFHSGGEALVGQDNWKALLRRVQTAADNAKPGSWMSEAKARAVGAAPSNMAEEIAAYAIENAENAPAGIREIADRLVGAVKAYVLRRFGKQFGAVTPGQLRALAIAALRSREAMSAAQTVDSARYSMASTATPAPGKKSAFERAKDKASNFLTDMMVGKGSNLGDFSLLALAPVRPLFMELTEGMPSARNYLDAKQAMDADRNAMNVEADKILQEWTKWASKNKDANTELMRLMHETTLEQYDPSPENRGKNAGPNPALQRAYDALPDEAKRLYSLIRDTYSERADAVEAQIIDNVKQAMGHTIRNAERKYNAEIQRIKDEGLTGEEKTVAEKAAKDALEMVKTRGRRNKAARLKRMREYFESNRLQGPYFPLARFGNYFVTVRDGDGKIVSFSKFETAAQQKAFAEDARAAYGKDAVQESLASRKTDEERSLDPRFIATIDSILDNADIDVTVRDQVYQAYLETLPDLSVRKSRIHRKGTAGYNEDAVRAFASQMFHGAHQLARLRFGMQLQDHLAEAATEVRNATDPVRTEAVLNEIKQAHDFIINPATSPLAHHMTSAVFLWTMAFNLSSAVVNASQTVTMAVPNLAFDPDTKAGINNATRQVAKATRDFMIGKGFAGNASTLTADERTAMKVGYDSGLIEDSQSHDLAGVAESGIDYNPKVQKVMRMASWPMHQVERFNREITYLAAYRIARNAGLDHQKAIRKASDLTWMSHFDNQSNAKPRFMRRDLGKVLFALKSYQANIIFRTFRDLHQALNGVDKETRNTALKRFAATFALTMGIAGVKGAFAYNTIMMIAGAFMGMLGDDDDPDEKLRKAVVEATGDTMVGRAVSGMLMDGVPGYITGTSISGRMGMADLWFHTNDRDFTPEQRWQNYLEQFLGAGVSRAHQAYSGAVEIMRGDVKKGLEKLLPGAFGNVIKAYRYATEGVLDKYGNPIVENVPTQDLLKQVIGFTPAEIADRRDRNNYQYNTQKRIKSEATDARKEVARARMAGDDAAEAEAQKKVDAFNDRYPEYAIRPKSIIQSMRSMENRKDRMEFGVDLDPKLAERVKGGTSPSIYAR